jgi:hypothetical protein
MPPPSHVELYEAVTSNSLDFVQSCLKAGADPSSVIGYPTIPLLEQFKDDDLDEYEAPAHVNFCLSSRNGHMSVLHLAVVNLYHRFNEARERDQALQILNSLLAHGANTEIQSHSLVMLHLKDKSSRGSLEEFKTEKNRAIDLVAFLKRFPDQYYPRTDEHLLRVLDDAIRVLLKAARQQNRTITSERTEPVLKSTIRTYERMLFSENYSDVTFECSDGEKVPAHQVVLAAASTYLKMKFEQDSWSEGDNGTWKTKHPSNLVQAFLTLVYTGTIDDAFSKPGDPLELLELASEFHTRPMTFIAVNACIRSINNSNLKATMEAAHRHEISKLLKSCFEFLQCKAPHLLAEPSIMALSDENPDLWKALRKHMRSSESSAATTSGAADKENTATNHPNKRARRDHDGASPTSSAKKK